MSTTETFWFIFWRMAFWGLGLGLGLGTAYGTLVGMPFYPFGLIFGPLLGAMCGTISGLPLGLLEGTVLGVLTLLQHRRGVLDNFLRYRRASELACVMVCILAVTTFLADGNSFSVRKAFTNFTRDPLESLVFVVVPLLVATGASWWAGRRVAGQYIDGVGEPASQDPTQATDKTLVEQERRR